MDLCEYITEWPLPETVPLPDEEQATPETKRCRIHREKFDGERSSSSFLICSPPSVKANILLAKWWKQRMPSVSVETTSNNPSTILFHISRLAVAKDFIQSRIAYLSNLSPSSSVNFSLATCYHLLGSDLENTMAAIKFAQLARTKPPQDEKEEQENDEEDNELEWLIELLKRQRSVEEAKERGRRELEKWPLVKLEMPQYTQVERRSCSDLSCEEFRDRYVLTHTPVVITDLVQQMTSKTWTLSYVKKVIGEKIAPLKKVVRGSIEWAQLEDDGECKVGAFIDSLEVEVEDQCYLFDWSLPLNCPELMQELTIPEYVADDFLQRTPAGSLYQDSWPSLFIAPAGLTSELHVDAFGSNFWMALFEGRKRWVVFPPEDLSSLSPSYHHSTDAVFQVDLSKWPESVCTHPLLSLTHPRECILDGGEFLFVPSGSPHRVENLDRSLAISANFVDASNYEVVKEELRINGLLDPQARELLNTLQASKFHS